MMQRPVRNNEAGSKHSRRMNARAAHTRIGYRGERVVGSGSGDEGSWAGSRAPTVGLTLCYTCLYLRAVLVGHVSSQRVYYIEETQTVFRNPNRAHVLYLLSNSTPLLKIVLPLPLS